MHNAALVFVESAIPLTLAELSKISHLPGIVQVSLGLNHCCYCHWIVLPRFTQMLAFSVNLFESMIPHIRLLNHSSCIIEFILCQLSSCLTL